MVCIFIARISICSGTNYDYPNLGTGTLLVPPATLNAAIDTLTFNGNVDTTLTPLPLIIVNGTGNMTLVRGSASELVYSGTGASNVGMFAGNAGNFTIPNIVFEINANAAGSTSSVLGDSSFLGLSSYTITNNGTLNMNSQGTGYGILLDNSFNSGTSSNVPIRSVSNVGAINANGVTAGIGILQLTTTGTTTTANSGTIAVSATTGFANGINVSGSGMSSVTNSNVITTSSSSGESIGISSASTNLVITNSGTITSTSLNSIGTAIKNISTATINNTGTLTGTTTGAGSGIGIWMAPSSTSTNVLTINNTGTITGATYAIRVTNGFADVNLNGGTINGAISATRNVTFGNSATTSVIGNIDTTLITINSGATASLTGSLNASPLTFAGGTLVTNSTSTSSGAVTFSSGARISPATSTTLTLSGNISGSTNSLTKNGAGILSITGLSVVYSGGTIINAGTLSTNSLGNAAGTVTFGGGTLATTSTISTSGAITFNSGAVIQPAASTILTFSGNISGSTNSLTMSGSGTLSLTGGSVAYSGGTIINSGTLSTNSLGNASGAVTFGGGTLLTNSTISTSGAVTFNAGAIISTATSTTLTLSGTITGGSNSLTKNGAGTLSLTGTLTAPYTGAIIINDGILSTKFLGDDSGTIIFGGGTLATTATITSARAISLNSNATIQPATSTILTLSGNINGSNGLAMSGAGTLVLAGTNSYLGTTSVTAGTLQATGSNLPANGTLAVSNTGIFNLTSGTYSGTVTNSNTINVSGILNPASGSTNNSPGVITINSGGQFTLSDQFSGTGSLVSNGTVTLAGTASLDLGSFNGSGSANTINLTITDATNYSTIDATGAVNLSKSSINISAPTVVNNMDWVVITSASNQLTAPLTVNLPSTGNFFRTWNYSVSASSLTVSLESLSFESLAEGQFNQEVAAVLDVMANNITNSGQEALISAFLDATSNAEVNNNLYQMMPNINAATANVVVQNNLFRVIRNRVVKSREIVHWDHEMETGVAYGELSVNTAVWMGGFGSIAKQKSYELNAGYRTKALGSIIGFDYLFDTGSLFGLALAISNSNIYEMSNSNYTTRILGYHGLIYGSTLFDGDVFIDWLLSGTYNNNRSSRPMNISGNNMAVSAFYHNGQGGLSMFGGKFINLNSFIRFTPGYLLQYSLIHQGPYAETGSVAALNINQKVNRSILTGGAGLRLATISDDIWLNGQREIHTLITYDAISAKNVTTANFVVGSNNFTVADNPSRIGILVGADFAIKLCSCLYLNLSYNFEWRQGYYDNSGDIKLKFVF